MSYSMWPIEVLAVNINEEYFNCLKKDLQNKESLLESLQKAPLGSLTKYQCELFQNLCEESEEILEGDLYDFYQEHTDYDNSYQRYEGGRNSENYAYAQKVNVNTGEFESPEVFDGIVYEFNWGSSNVYEPQFKNKMYLIEEIKKNLYIPTTFDLENNIILVTGVCGG